MSLPDNLLVPAVLSAAVSLAVVFYLDRRLDRQLLHLQNWAALRARLASSMAGTCWWTVMPIAAAVYPVCLTVSSLRQYASVPLAAMLVTALMIIPLLVVRSLTLADRAR